MIQEFIRPLSDPELGQLRANVQHYSSRRRSVGCAVSLGIAAFLLALLLVSFSTALATKAAGRISLIAGLAVAALAYFYAPRPPADPTLRQQLDDDIAAGLASVTTYTVYDAIQVAEEEDEGFTFFLSIDEGKVLFINGQYLYDLVGNKQAPARTVTVTKAPRSGFVLGVSFSNEYLAPSTLRAPLTEREWDEFSLDGDGSVLNEPLEVFRHPRS